MTDWRKAWKIVTKPSARRGKKAFKKLNHRANRNAAKRLEDRHIRLNGWDVT
jgi:hypothetical protein